MSRKLFNYARTETLRRKLVTQRDHLRARDWLCWFLLAAAVVIGWPSIMTVVLFIGAFGRLAYVLWRWVDAQERRTTWRNSLGKA